MLEAKTISISIRRNWRDIFDAFWRPEDFPRWASGLSRSGVRKDGDSWKAEGPEGPISIRFTDYNPYGVMDHWVHLGHAHEVYVPLRVIANGNGAEVLLTLFRQPDMTNERFDEDVEWVRRDLTTLKALAEALPLAGPSREP